MRPLGPFKDVEGRRFGKLIAIEVVDHTPKGWRWLCGCDCGNTHVVSISHLMAGTVKSCGCYRREMALQKIKHTHTGITKDRRKWLLLNGARCRARKQKVPCTITIDDIIIPALCPLLEIPLVFGKGKVGKNSPTLDKIIPKLGYVAGNVWVISAKANVMKSSATLEECELLARNWRALQ